MTLFPDSRQILPDDPTIVFPSSLWTFSRLQEHMRPILCSLRSQLGLSIWYVLRLFRHPLHITDHENVGMRRFAAVSCCENYHKEDSKRKGVQSPRIISYCFSSRCQRWDVGLDPN